MRVSSGLLCIACIAAVATAGGVVACNLHSGNGTDPDASLEGGPEGGEPSGSDAGAMPPGEQ